MVVLFVGVLLFGGELRRCRVGFRYAIRRFREGLRSRLAERRVSGRYLRRLGHGSLRRKRLALHDIAVPMAARAPMPVSAAPAGAIVGFNVGCTLVVLFLRDQCLPVGDRDLIVVRVDFRESQEAVAVAAVVDECRLQGRLNACDFGEIDITAKLFAVGALEIEFFDAIAA